MISFCLFLTLFLISLSSSPPPLPKGLGKPGGGATPRMPETSHLDQVNYRVVLFVFHFVFINIIPPVM